MIKELSICVAALTRHRPQLLRNMLASWATVRLPSHARVVFLIVENSHQSSSKHFVDWFQSSSSDRVLHHILEPRIGIPFARNRAIQYVIETGADLLLFIDDDEIVHTDWLVEMVESYRNTGSLLIGGPVRALPPYQSLSRYSSILFRGIEHRYRTKARKAERRYLSGRAQLTTVVTNNWLGHRDLFTKFGLRFDETFDVGGGSDAKFDDDASRLGVVKSWAPKAEVSEIILPSRISFAYQFRRSRDQSIQGFYRKKAERPTRVMLSLPLAVLFRFCGMLVTILALPFTGGASLIALARSSGWIAGRVLAAFGAKSQLYKEIAADIGEASLVP